MLILTPPFLPLTASDALVNTIEASLKIAEAVQSLLAWMRGGIKDSEPQLNILGALDLEDQVTGDRKKMWSELVPASQPVTPQAPNYIMQTAPEQVQVPQTPNTETPP